MKQKFIVLSIVLLMLVGCSKPKDESTLKVLAPKGAPSLSLVNYAKEYSDAVTLVDGTDVITAALVSPNQEYDVIIAPINLGTKLIEKGSTPYRLHSVVTWGNLYLVKNMDVTGNEPMALFGEGAVPQKIFDTVMASTPFEQDIQYFNSVADVQAQLLSNKVSYGLFSEPTLTITLAKAKEKNINLEIAYDLQEMWNQKTGYNNYPQAAMFVLPSAYEKNMDNFDVLVNSIISVTKETIEADLTGNEEMFGVPNSKAIATSWDNINMQYEKAQDKKEEITFFLKLFNIQLTDDMMIKEAS